MLYKVCEVCGASCEARSVWDMKCVWSEVSEVFCEICEVCLKYFEFEVYVVYKCVWYEVCLVCVR